MWVGGGGEGQASAVWPNSVVEAVWEWEGPVGLVFGGVYWGLSAGRAGGSAALCWGHASRHSSSKHKQWRQQNQQAEEEEGQQQQTAAAAARGNGV